MKKIFVILLLVAANLPVYADLVIPSMTNEAREEFLARRKYNYHLRTINRVCGGVQNLSEQDCKASLKKDYKETLKYFEQRMKAEKQSAKKSSKVTIQNVKNTGKSSKSNQK